MQRDCSWSDLFSYSACSLLVALSKSESRIIISFEGTQNTPQLLDQMIAASFRGLNETKFGGKVCIKSSSEWLRFVSELLVWDSGMVFYYKWARQFLNQFLLISSPSTSLLWSFIKANSFPELSVRSRIIPISKSAKSNQIMIMKEPPGMNKLYYYLTY